MKNFKIFLLVLNLVAIRLAVPVAQAQTSGVTFTTLAAFNATNNGANPYAPPVFGADGNLYGTLPYGGTNLDGVGAIFKLTTNATTTMLHFFNTWDGVNPYASLASGSDGNLYGVAYKGGTNNLGTLFKITTNGTFTLLYSFGMTTNALGYALDGASPLGGLVQGRNGNLYGTTLGGGSNNLGTVFQFSTNGVLTTLHSFTGSGANHDGASPYMLSPLVEGADGIFYGTTSAGGSKNDGTIFRVITNGTLTTLFEFDGTHGQGPWAGLNFGTDGNLYGSASQGGTNGSGTVFRITTNGVLTTLFHFGGADGIYYPYGGAVPGNNNTLFGTTYRGGSAGNGTVFQVTTNGVLTVLRYLDYTNDGANPIAGVIRDAGGNLYGSALYGGTNGGYGTVFCLNFTALLAILSPTANSLWTTNLVTIAGTASDNAPGGAITNVSYSLNGGAWTNAGTTNGWINWTGSANLTQTNAVLTVSTNGLGSLSTNYNGRSLQALTPNTIAAYAVDTKGNATPTNTVIILYGKNYSITATPGTGFVFTNWTGGTNLPLSVVTNGTTVQFVMAPNLMLQANFLDVTKPTLSITNLVAGQRVSNTVFTVRGTTSDNWQVSNVVYQLNGGAWSNALSVNNWTNWSGAVILWPGTNSVLAYAVDTTGNRSATNGVTFQYVVTNLLGVSATGLGTLSPNYSNAWLEVGRNYTMTATPGSGFVVTNWVISTNWVGGAVTNNAVVQFMMASNLTLQINFLDITKPVLTVSFPSAGQHMTNALASLTGTASDNWKVASVWYQLNSNAWSLANTTNSYTNWNRTVTLLAGTNTLKVYALDLGGNYSATNSFSVVSSNAFNLQLTFAAGQPLTTNGLNYIVQVSTNVNGHILVSTDLLNWTALTNFVGTNATLNFRDAAATNFNQRFYRAVTP